MTKKEGNQQNSNTRFKIKIFKKEVSESETEVSISKGLYQQLNSNYNRVTYNSGTISLTDILKPLQEAFNKNLANQQREVKILTGAAGKDMFDKALIEEMIKFNKKHGNRKKISFRSKVFK